MTSGTKDDTEAPFFRFPAEEGVVVLTALAASAASARPFRFEAGESIIPALAPLFGGCVQERGSEAIFLPRALPRGGTHRVVLPEGVELPALLSALSAGLASAQRPGTFRLEAPTHPASGPSFHDYALSWNEHLEACGLGLEVGLEWASFGEDRSGVVAARLFPSPRVRPLRCVQRGLLLDVQVVVLVPSGERRLAQLVERAALGRLRARGIAAEMEGLPMPVRGRQAAVVLEARFEKGKASFTSLVSPENIEQAADRVVERLALFLERRGALEARCAESLLLPAALAASRAAPGGIGASPLSPSRFSTSEVSTALLGVAQVVRELMAVEVRVLGLPGQDGVVEVRPGA